MEFAKIQKINAAIDAAIDAGRFGKNALMRAYNRPSWAKINAYNDILADAEKMGGTAYIIGVNKCQFSAVVKSAVKMVYYTAGGKKIMYDLQNAGDAENMAIDWQNWQSKQSMSWGDVANWRCLFEAIGREFDIFAEFRENYIC